MIRTLTAPAALLLAMGTLAGCANDGTLGSSNLTTAAVTPTVAPAAKVDPACVTLAAQIDTLRKEGTIDRLQQAAAGKTASVQVKRTALAKQAELNKANADFQSKCATITPAATTTAAAAPAPVAAQAAAAAAPAAKTAVKKATAAAPVAKAAAPVAAAAPAAAAGGVIATVPKAQQ
jgi:hypothetical protein